MINKYLCIKKCFTRALLLLPIVYICFGWYVGLKYARKPVIFGPYPDIPVVVKTHLLGSYLKDISGASALMMVVPPRDINRDSQKSSYFTRVGYFEIPGSWKFDFAPSGAGYSPKKTFALTGSYSRAICHDLRSPDRNLGSLSVSDFNDFLKRAGRTSDVERLKPYLFLSRLEEKCPWVYSETVFLSKAMGNIFKDNLVPYDVLGLIGIGILFITLALRGVFLWMYYLYWVFSYWLARIGYHDPSLAFTSEGWQVIFWSFWHGFILKEGRLFLVIALGLLAIVFGIWVLIDLALMMSKKTRRAIVFEREY
ncbi:MAG: hypothetical protein KJ661_04050 [Candidatus Omnitrophica bacterium]|nr:hypothetical protein [Candidatus Omnitrophota bacterium]